MTSKTGMSRSDCDAVCNKVAASAIMHVSRKRLPGHSGQTLLKGAHAAEHTPAFPNTA